MALLGAAAVAAMTGLAWVLLSHASRGVTEEVEAAKLRVEVIRTVLTVGAGTGGAMALLLAVRRQWLAERAQLHTEEDAAEQRITELYVQAAEQLGSDKAPVRLAGLYALERLAQDNAAHRQTIVEVICAYLRMPYSLPPDEQTPVGHSDFPEEQPAPAAEKKINNGYDPHEERQVRLTAQRILTRHLRPVTGPDNQQSPALKFWADVDIDLSGALLMGINFSRCQLRTADFTATTFTGGTRFDEAIFNGDAEFRKATWHRDAWFGETTFNGDVGFRETTFNGNAWFGEATFNGDVGFRETTFNGDAGFGKATFNGNAWFDEVTGHRDAWFSKATFNGDARFSEATFTGNTWFSEATFNGSTWLDEATVDSLKASAKEVPWNDGNDSTQDPSESG